jgi:GNAT superfamily N-acetyltransferase
MTSNGLEGKAARLVRRPENASDQAFLLALFSSHRAAPFAALGLPEQMLETMMRQQFHAQSTGHRAQHPNARREIVETDGEDMGRLVSDLGDTHLHLVDIALAPAWRGQGLGALLISQLLDEARAAALPVTLQVARDNPAANLYARLGFEMTTADEVYQYMRWTPGRRAPAGR